MNSLIVQNQNHILTEDKELDFIKIYPGCTLDAPNGKGVTMVIDGKVTRILPGEYHGKIKLSVRDLFIRPYIFIPEMPTHYRGALYVNDGQVDYQKSFTDAIQGGQITDQSITGAIIEGHDFDFNGIYVNGDSNFTIKNLKMDMTGNGTHDFQGKGFCINAAGNATLTLEDCDVHAKGVGHGTLYGGDASKVIMRRCKFFAETTNELPVGYKDHLGLDESFTVLWMMGLTGSNRMSYFGDNATVEIEDSHLISDSWGILSSDMPQKVRMNVKNSIIEQYGDKNLVYGALVIGDTLDVFDHCLFKDVTYPVMMSANQGSCVFKNGTITNSYFGVVAYRNYLGKMDILDGCILNTEDSCLITKGGAPIFHVRRSILNPKNKVILQVMDNEECCNADGYYVEPIGEDDVYEEGRDITHSDPTEDVFATFEDMALNGDIYNASTNLLANMRCPQVPMPFEPMAGAKHHGFEDDLQGAKNLDLNFKSVTCIGCISSTRASHNVITITNRNVWELYRVTNKVQKPVNNGIILHMDSRSTWTVTEHCYITGLYLEEGAIINAPEGKKLIMTIDEKETAIAPGEYHGIIEFTLK